MKEQLISFETAKLAKKLGFKNAYEFYDEEGIIEPFGMEGGYTDCTKHNYAAPTQSLLQKWLREEHGIFVIILPKATPSNTIVWYNNFDVKEAKNSFEKTYKTYEEAFEVGLQKGLELLEQNKKM